MNRSPRLLLILAVCFATLTGIAATQDAAKAPVQKPPAAKDDSPDAWLTMKVKLALLTTKDVPAMAIDVDTVHDVVTLSGKVETEAAKTKAGEVAKGIEGVKQVKNILQVVPESSEKVVDKADAEIKDAVQKAFDADSTLKGISVKSVDKGVVLLAGKATTKEALRAVQAAYKTAGVRQVSSEIALER
jgi:hyperosmotically inducible periplasmic protein